MKAYPYVAWVLAGTLLMSVPVYADTPAGAGAAATNSAVTTASETTATTPSATTPSATTEKPWEKVQVTDDAEKNGKLDYYTKEPDAEKTIGNGKLVELFSFELPANTVEQLKYTGYPLQRHYLMNLSGAAMIVRAEPKLNATVIQRIGAYQNIQTDASVSGDSYGKPSSDRWFRVQIWIGGKQVTGYVHSSGATKRTVQIPKMVEKLNALKKDLDTYQTGYIANYKNATGRAPKHWGKDVDAFGRLRDESAAAYYSASASSDFRYFQDGTLLNMIGQVGNFYQVTTVDYPGTFYVEKRFVTTRNSIDTMTKAIVIDRNNQNEAVFEYVNGKWVIISIQRVATGANSKYKQPTDLGNYMVIERKSKFEYLDDITKEIAGYSPYALRFNGGAYIHSLPVNYVMVKQPVVVTPAVLDATGKVLKPAVTKDVVVSRKDPGHREYFPLIGVYPRTHKCVNNFTSHAKFLYDWAEIGKTAVIVIE